MTEQEWYVLVPADLPDQTSEYLGPFSTGAEAIRCRDEEAPKGRIIGPTSKKRPPAKRSAK